MKNYQKWILQVFLILILVFFNFAIFAQDLVLNGGFEAEGDNWTSEGDTMVISYFANDGHTHSGNFRLSHWDTEPYEVFTYQTITGLKADTTYRLRAWADSTVYVNPEENDNECAFIVKDFGGDELRVDVIETDGYTQFEIGNINVTNGQCTIGFKVKTDSESWCAADDIQFYDENGEIPPIPEKEENAKIEPIYNLTKSKNLILNPSFEDPLPIYDDDGNIIDYDYTKPANWTIEGDTWGYELKWSDWTYAENREDSYQLTSKWDDYPYAVKAFQKIKNLKPGKYIFKAFVAAGMDAEEGQINELSINLKNFNSKDENLKIAIDTSGIWKEYKMEFEITSEEILIEIYSDTVKKVWANIDDLILVKSSDKFFNGVDISESQRNLNLGGIYMDENGIIKDPVKILYEKGINLIRIRTWVNPANGICGKESTLNAVTRTLDAGIKNLIIDFHYSDTWADPGKQYVPEEWLAEIDDLIDGIQTGSKIEINSIKKQITIYSSLLKLLKHKKRNKVNISKLLKQLRYEIENKRYRRNNKKLKEIFLDLKDYDFIELIQIIKVKLHLKKQLFKLLLNFTGLPEEIEEISKIKLMELGFDYTVDMTKEIEKIKKQYGKNINLIYQMGNEIIFGTLWPYFELETNDLEEFKNLARFLNIVIKAVNIISPDAKILIHSDHKDDAEKPLEERRIPNFAKKLIDAGIEYDILGYSYYDVWHGSLTTLCEMINYIKDDLGKEIMNVEFSKPWTSDDKDGGNVISNFTYYDVPLTVEGQAQWISLNIEVNKMLNTSGVCYWGGTYTAVTGNGWDPTRPYESQCSWENQALFDFDGQILDSIDAFNE